MAASKGKLVEPDLNFIREISRLGGDSFKKCYQCATCSATCPISPDDKPFPRKEMVWSIWGWKDHLIKDPDVWLCHQCNDCSAVCPREGNPGDILAVIRKYSYLYYAFPKFMGKFLYEPKYLPIIAALPFVILFVIVALFGNFQPEGDIVFKKFLSHPFPLDFLFILVAMFALVSAAVGGMRFWKALQEGPRPPVNNPRGFTAGLIEAVKEVATHKQFNECDKANPRFYSHLLTFYGFVALFITTSLVFLGLYLLDLETPLPLLNPIKILGNLGALAFLIGTGMMLYLRLTDEERAGKNSYNDWLFLGLMFGLAVSGVLTEALRLAGIAVAAYSMYFVHLALILSMMVYFPFSKFAHLLYRTLAIVYYHGYAASASEAKEALMENKQELKDETVQPNAA